MANDTILLANRPVARMGFGAMQLPGPGVLGPPKDRDQALAVVRRCIELGVNHIDTAQFYGPDVANELLYEALFPYPDDLVLVSKVGAARNTAGQWLPAQTPEALRAGVEANLASLHVDQLAVVNLRRHGEAEVSLDQQLVAMSEMVDEGLISAIGLSNVDLADYERGAARWTSPACRTPTTSSIDRAKTSLTPVGVTASPTCPSFPWVRPSTNAIRSWARRAVTEAARRRQASPAQIALAWLLSRGPNVLVIAGTSSLAHLEENMAAADLVLDEEDLAALDQAVPLA